MWEFIFYSRGGQGAVTAAKILVSAAIADGKFAQAIPSYGQERKGAPVYTYARIDAEPIEVKSYVYNPNCIVVFDKGLPALGIDVFSGLQKNATMVLNAPEGISLDDENLGVIAQVDADAITQDILGNAPPNVAMLGALVKATGCVSIASLKNAISSKIPGKAGESNAAACARAFEETTIHEKA